MAAGAAAGSARPLVGIIMGSDSDLPTMRAAADILEKFEVPYELTIVSAHRTPARMTAYATVRERRVRRASREGVDGGSTHTNYVSRFLDGGGGYCSSASFTGISRCSVEVSRE